MKLFPLFMLCVMLFALLPAASPPVQAQNRQPTTPPGLFGLNTYITGQERSDAEATALVELAVPIGVRWAREEICWACWGDRPENAFYDRRIKLLADAGIGIIGMLLTTPERYRDPACVRYARSIGEPEYWCAPTDMAAYARWVGQVVERYNANGVNDAPGSPRIAVWQIWNEPDQDGTWLPRADPAAYATMQRLAYAAIKQADPTAIVLNGGVYTFDAVGQNGFMDQVVANGGWDSFDALAIHPWLIDHAPDNPDLINPREGFDVTIPGRIALAQRWLAARGGKPLWITEVGWATCGSACAPQFAKSLDEQADYLVRTFVLAAAAGVAHVSYFQLEDKFNGGQQPWGPAAILNNDRSPKPAYVAYGVLVSLLQFAQYERTGALHRPNDLVHHRFRLPDGGSVDVLWSLRGPRTVDLPLTGGFSAALLDRVGATTPLGGTSARLTLSERPIYVRQLNERSRTFAETNQQVRDPFLRFWEQNGGLAVFGLPLTPERIERTADGRERRVQWFERNRFEAHPELAPPFDVQLGLLGVEALERRGIDWRALPKVNGPPAPNCRYFPETRQSLCPPFRAFWERNGGLAVFGYPISEPQAEMVEGGRTLTVQWFERNRFEWHPELPPAFRVQLGRLGAELQP
jgi:hypothetical protein